MPEAVIVATGRTPIGRANKGSLVECRPDDLSALVIREVLAKVPQLDPQTVEDVLWGCGQPAGEAGYNLARVAAVLGGLAEVPGVTVNRYCSSSLQTIRMAAHAIKDCSVLTTGEMQTILDEIAANLAASLPAPSGRSFPISRLGMPMSPKLCFVNCGLQQSGRILIR